MSKVVLVTPGLNYESFMDPDENPLLEAKVLVASTEDEYKEILREGLRIAFDIHGYDEDWNPLATSVKKPVEPMIKLSEANTAKADRLKKAYGEELEAYETALQAKEETTVIFDGSSLASVSVEKLESWVKTYQDSRTDGEVPSLYVYEA